MPFWYNAPWAMGCYGVVSLARRPRKSLAIHDHAFNINIFRGS